MIHPFSIVSKKAKIGVNVTIGPFCTIGDEVEIGDNVTLKSHISIDGVTKIGEGCTVFPFVSISMPQDLKYKGERSEVVIGKNNVIREYVTIQHGTEAGGMVTQIGDNCLLMVGVHIAHDCKIGNNVIFANLATLAGHVEVGDFVVFGGLSAAHQFVRIGDHAMIGGCSAVERDVAPFATVTSERAGVSGINFVGLKRRGLDRQEITSLQKAFQIIFFEDSPLSESVEKVKRQFKHNPHIDQLIKFITSDSKRSLTMRAKSGSEAV
ncbi:MAG: acyl-ACP--UDP-N-acetylglucosamine O-acyltransferase [Rickettsiaceae bacterium]|nr:acyl-ACP--UDP-N-acetylglucosamine O-acyltransferase [Rickettsiaceae bacterium]